MFAKIIKLALAGLVLTGFAQGAAAQAVRASSALAGPSTSLYKNVLYVSQSTELGQASSSQPEARFGPLTNSKGSYGVRVNLTDLSFSAQLAELRLPRIPMAGTQTTESALATSKQWMLTNRDAYLKKVSEFVRQRGIGIAYFSYYQAVNVQTATGARKMGIMWSGTVDIGQRGGGGSPRALYGDPRLVDGEPVFLDVQYFPKRTGEGVLAEEGYAHAGKILWRLMDKGLQPLPTPGASDNGYVIRDVGGAYDSPSTVEGDIGAVSCFIDKRHPNCTLRGIAAVDSATLAAQAGASGVFAYYAHSAELDTVLSNGDWLPVVSVSYDKRELSCTELTQVMSISKQITLNGNLYYGQFNGTYFDYALMDRVTRKQFLEPTSYSRKAPVIDVVSSNDDPFKLLLSPFPGAGPDLPQTYSLKNRGQALTEDFLSHVSGIANVDDVREPEYFDSPLHDSVKSGPNSYVVEFPVERPLPTPDNEGKFMTEPATVEFELGLGSTRAPSPDNNLAAWQVQSASFSFNVADKSKVTEFRLTELGFEDIMQVTINGTQIVHTAGGSMIAQASTPAGAQCSGAMIYKQVCTSYIFGDSETCLTWENRGTWWPDPYAAGYAQISNPAYLNAQLVPCQAEGACTDGYAFYPGPGCTYMEQGGSHRQTKNINLRPYLVNGANSISIKVAVGMHGGEGWIRVRSSAVPTGCQPVPTTPSLNPLEDKTLTVQAQDPAGWVNTVVLAGTASGTIEARSVKTPALTCTLRNPGSSCVLEPFPLAGTGIATAVNQLIDAHVPVATGGESWSEHLVASWNIDGSVSVSRYAGGGTADFSRGRSPDAYYSAARGTFYRSTLDSLPKSASLRLTSYYFTRIGQPVAGGGAGPAPKPRLE